MRIPNPALTASFPQLRRSPIKKVRKSLALDIVDEDGKLMMSTLPKVLSLVRGRRDAVPAATPELQRLFCPREEGLPLEASALGPFSCGEDLEVEWPGGSHGPSSAPAFAESSIRQDYIY